jgi:hypothetical protein
VARPRPRTSPPRAPLAPTAPARPHVPKAPTAPSWWHYVRKAFTWRWNMLVFGGGAVAALISGAPDVALPLVVAAELVYLGGLTAAPKFRAAVEAELHAQNAPAEQADRAQQSLGKLLSGLAPARRERFQRLLTRCLDMKRIAAGVRGHSGEPGQGAVATPALDRMLWAFVRLLWSQQALERFLHSTDHGAIETRIGELQQKIASIRSAGAAQGDAPQPTAPEDEKILRSLVDSLATAELRSDNLQKARRNAEFVEIELDRIEGKIQALVEMSVGHEDADALGTQVDSVAESIAHTEEAIREMRSITGLQGDADEAAPAILANLEQIS